MNLHIISSSVALDVGHGKEYIENVVNNFPEFNKEKKVFNKITLHTTKVNKKIVVNKNIEIKEHGNKHSIDKNYYANRYKKLWKVFFGLNRIAHYYYLYQQVKEYIEKGDTIYFLEYEYFSLAFNKIIRNKSILTLHTMDFNKNSYSAVESLYKFVSKYLNIITFNKSHKIIVHGKFIEETFKRNYSKFKNKVVVADYGIDDRNVRINKNVALMNIESSYNIKLQKNKVTLLFFGLIRQNKGIDKFLKEYIKLKTADIQLLIVGKNYDIDAYEINELVKTHEDIHWINEYIAEEDIKYFYSLSDYLVLPYLKNMNSQSGPLKIAMSYLTPVIASQYGEIGYFVEEYGVGYIIDTENYIGLEKTLENAKTLNNKNINKNIENVKHDLTWNKMSKVIWDSIIK